MSLDAPNKLLGSSNEISPFVPKRTEDWGIRPDDLLAILIFLFIAVLTAFYIKCMIMSCLGEVGRISSLGL